MSNNVIDTASPFLRQIARTMPRKIDSATKSAGWFLREEMKKGIDKQAPGGNRYSPLSDITRDRLLDAVRNRKRTKRGKWRAPRRLKAREKPMGRLYQATKYVYYRESKRVIIGWLSRSAEKLGAMQEKGTEIEITPRMRRFFFAAGIPLSKSKSKLRIPSRATVEPTHRVNESKMGPYIENKIWESIMRDERR